MCVYKGFLIAIEPLQVDKRLIRIWSYRDIYYSLFYFNSIYCSYAGFKEEDVKSRNDT